jgi:oligosaccharyltransferase complex subunit delta (ribophorin II)
MLQAALLLASLSPALAASSWSFSEASLTVQGKGSGVGTGLKEKYEHSQPIFDRAC